MSGSWGKVSGQDSTLDFNPLSRRFEPYLWPIHFIHPIFIFGLIYCLITCVFLKQLTHFFLLRSDHSHGG